MFDRTLCPITRSEALVEKAAAPEARQRNRHFSNPCKRHRALGAWPFFRRP